MLDTIKSILNEDVISFDEYYMIYCMRVQDDNIEQEAISKMRRLEINVNSLNQIDRYMYAEQGKMVK